jgi:S1-C subfamily serine protease
MAENKDEYNLYTEKIVSKPWFRSKKITQLIKVGLLSVFAGVVAGLTFLFVISAGYSELDINKEVYNEVTIPMDEELGSTDDTDASGTDNQVQLPEDAELAGNNQGSEETGVKDGNIYDYVSGVVDGILPSYVTVTAISQNEDPLFAVTRNEADYPGVIIADNGVEYLILTDYEAGSVNSLEVEFYNGISVNAQYVMADKNVNIAVVAVKHTDIPLSTRTAIKIVDMGNSYMLGRSDMVIAMGNLYGINDAMDFGMVVSTKENAYDADSKHGLVYTNLSGAENSRGFIFNEEGQLVGNIYTGMSSDNLVAYGISDIKIRIQNISNQKSIGYLGIIGRDVSQQTAEDYDMPAGVFVTSVEMNSPAYFAGIFQGDIIADIGGRTISNVYNIERTMCEFEPGTEVVVTVYRYGRDGYVPIEYTITLKEKN